MHHAHAHQDEKLITFEDPKIFLGTLKIIFEYFWKLNAN